MIYYNRLRKSIENIARSFNHFKTFKESFAALIFGFGGLIAGSIIVAYSSLIFLRPWIILMYPIVLSARGAINGVLSGRLGTALHTRLIEPSFRKNTRHYYLILASIMNQSLISSVLGTLIISLISLLMFKSSYLEMIDIFFTCLVANALSVIVMVPFSSALGFLTYKRGFDPDVFLYPISATIADIWTSISFVFTLGLMFLYRPFNGLIIYLIGTLFIIIVFYLSSIFRKEEDYWKSLKETFLMFVFVIPISAMSGISLSKVSFYLRTSPGLLSVYPALINCLGASGAIFGSHTTTKLALGLINAKIIGIKGEIKDIVQIGGVLLLMYIFYASIAYFIGSKIIIFAIILISFALLFPIIIFVTFSIGIIAFIRGLDPDNFIIPLETTLTDCLLSATLSFLLVLFLAI